MADQSPADIVRHASTWSIVWGVLLIVFGMLAVGSPFVAAVAVSVVIAWLSILAGVVAAHGPRCPQMPWHSSHRYQIRCRRIVSTARISSSALPLFGASCPLVPKCTLQKIVQIPASIGRSQFCPSRAVDTILSIRNGLAVA